MTKIRIVYWWNAKTTITHQDLCSITHLWPLGKLFPSSHQGSECSNTILCSFKRWDQRIREGIPIPDSLREEATLYPLELINQHIFAFCSFTQVMGKMYIIKSCLVNWVLLTWTSGLSCWLCNWFTKQWSTAPCIQKYTFEDYNLILQCLTNGEASGQK